MTNSRKVLPAQITPIEYMLLLDTDTEKETFSGSLTITMLVTEPTKNIILNSTDLNINKIKINEKQVDFNIKDDNLIINYEVFPGNYLVSILYDGKISKEMNGYYISRGDDPMFSTHFEPTSARSAFPCFDQPDMKAVFRIMLLLPGKLVGLSNCEVEHEIKNIKDLLNEKEDKNQIKKNFLFEKKTNDESEFSFNESILKNTKNEKLLIFKKSPIMSTYLVAWVIGNISYIERISDYEPKIKMRVYSAKEDVKNGKYALDVAHDCIKIFQDYFKIDYPLEKLDMVGIPEFAMGAMENWGLITYRKSSLLYDEKKSPLTTKKNVAETVCHELAHQWFGNLATMKWWNDLWLNEGFATWAAALGVSNLSKDLVDWDIWTAFISSDVEYGMGYDSLNSTHEIQIEVNDPEDIDQIFDGISYSKGASLIRMIEDYIGADKFRNGLSNYLKRFEYGNAETNDLWNELEKASGKDNITEMMNYWTRRKGFPLIRIEENNNFLNLTQERFYLIKDYKKEDLKGNNERKEGDNKEDDKKEVDKKEDFIRNDDKKEDHEKENELDKNNLKNNEIIEKNNQDELEETNWTIPVRVNFIKENNNSPKKIKSQNPFLFELTEKQSIGQIEKISDVYKLNDDGIGFYRVLYKNEENIIKLLKDSKLSSKNRLNLMNDLFQLSIGSYIKYETPIQASLNFKNENNCDVLFSVLGGLSEIKGIFYDVDDKKKELSEIMLDLVKERVDEIDLKNGGKDANEVSLNTSIINTAVSNDDKNTIEKLFNLFEDYKKDNSIIHPSFRKAMFTSLIKKNEENIFGELWNIYKNESADDVKNNILLALGNTVNEKEISFLLNEFLGKTIKMQDKIYLISSLMGNFEKRNEIIDFVIDKYDDISKMFDKHSSLFAYVIERVFSCIADSKRRQKSVELFRKYKIKSYERAVEKSLERSAVKINFRKING
ncbi:hypothetical protein GVAV_000508 [Gurleya vavrai]